MENLRYKAFKASLEKMKDYDNFMDLYYDLGDPTQLLLDEELRERFVHIDFRVMRVALWTTSIPPPKNEVDGTADIEVIDDKNVGSYQCTLKLKNEEIC